MYIALLPATTLRMVKREWKVIIRTLCSWMLSHQQFWTYLQKNRTKVWKSCISITCSITCSSQNQSCMYTTRVWQNNHSPELLLKDIKHSLWPLASLPWWFWLHCLLSLEPYLVFVWESLLLLWSTSNLWASSCCCFYSGVWEISSAILLLSSSTSFHKLGLTLFLLFTQPISPLSLAHI